jgi:hypothetical protein
MKSIQRFILPIMILLIGVLVYTTYFSPSKGLGSFSDFDPNNNANKDIRVRLVQERGIKMDPGGASVFYVEDRAGQIVMVQGPPAISPEVRSAEVVILRGHLHKEYFHAADVVAD